MQSQGGLLPRRRHLFALAGGLLAAPHHLRAQSWPARTVRVINAYSPGGTADVVSRLVLSALSARMGQQFIVENRPGAAGTVAAQAVVHAAPDGYTLLYDATAHSVNPSLFGARLSYDTRRDLLPVFLTILAPNTLLAHNGLPAKSVAALIALAKANPGMLDCCSTGVGKVQHVALELFNHLAGTKINHIPYRDAGAARNDVLSGRVPLQFVNVTTAVPIFESKALQILAHCALHPLAVLPGIPAMAETLPGFEAYEWNGLFAPAGTPREIILKLNAELNTTMREPAVAERLAPLGALMRANTVEEFAAFREQQIAFFADMVRMANIRIE